MRGQGNLGRAWMAPLLVALMACASIPKHQYGVSSVRVTGMQKLNDQALLACLATQERKKVSLGLSALRDPSCGEPPFGPKRAALDLFAWPWTDWPVYDEAVLKLDVKRVERWYQARGYYGASVVNVKVEPQAANVAPRCDAEDCTVDLTIHVEQGKPVRIRNVRLQNAQGLAPELEEELQEALGPLAKDEVFDEAIYEQVKEDLGKILREAGYARSAVSGDVAVHRGLLWVDVTIKVEPGVMCEIGEVRIASASPVPTGPVRAASLLKPGQTYHESDLEDAQRAIYALGSFTAVNVRGELEGEGKVVDVVIELEPRRERELLLGAGVMSGVLATGPLADEWMSVPQWDIHLLARYEHRNFMGGLRRFHVEERPRLLFLGAFPAVPEKSPQFGNTINATFSQPGVIEPRTSLVTEARWDYGPDPFLLFFRHDIGAAVGLERGFFRQRLSVRVAIHQDILQVLDYQPIIADDDAPSSYRLPFLEQRVVLDLRDDAGNPSRGGYFRVSVHEAAWLWDPGWTYVRVTPEARGYAPIGLGMVLAARFALGSLHIRDASPPCMVPEERGKCLDEESRKLGPQTYRLRGGGAQSNRGFGPGELGDGERGGIRRWESSLELRVPLSANFSIASFVDMGDVHAAESFRFRHLNTAVGGGMRYRTIIGPIRFDVGYRPPSLQRARGAGPEDTPQTDLRFAKFNGALHLTIGESF